MQHGLQEQVVMSVIALVGKKISFHSCVCHVVLIG